MDWTVLALGSIAIGVSLPIVFRKNISFFEYPVTKGVTIALLVIGFLQCFMPPLQRMQKRRKPIPLALFKKFVDAQDGLEWLRPEDTFSRVISVLAMRKMVHLFGVRGDLNGISDRLEEIPPNHFNDHSIWIQCGDGRIVSETYRNDMTTAAVTPERDRYFGLHVSRNILDQVYKIVEEILVAEVRSAK